MDQKVKEILLPLTHVKLDGLVRLIEHLQKLLIPKQNVCLKTDDSQSLSLTIAMGKKQNA